ncbi:MAG: nicotinate-nucleotide diphosphorylase [Planctomycetaceae bacterium]
MRECTHDGALLTPGERVATLNGPTASLLTGERTALNFVTHLSGIATLTQRFVEAAAGGKAVILDTRKTLPGWRVLQKYAVRCGGGTNHRLGLYDGILIKDNHLAARYGARTGQPPASESSRSFQVRPLSIAVEEARARAPAGMRIEIEVDSLEQLQDALHARPDIILLDNFTPERMREAVAARDQQSRETLLEASGGVNLDTIARIAATGVDFISIGALTHSAPVLDLAFDWESAR